MKQALLDLLGAVADDLDARPEAHAWVVWGICDGLREGSDCRPDPSTMSGEQYEHAYKAWEDGYMLGQKHRRGLP